ncbi:MAG TPA: hypothetical protein VGG20_10780 [Thermoanaerobaculia bacterium]|jgi:hypothetical protein
MPNTTITAIYNPNTNSLSLSPDGNINVNCHETAIVTINLSLSESSNCTGVWRAEFATTPISWGNAGAPPGNDVQQVSPDELVITVPNHNDNTASMSYPFTVNMLYYGQASLDPTIVNEGTGGPDEGTVGPLTALQAKAA